MCNQLFIKNVGGLKKKKILHNLGGKYSLSDNIWCFNTIKYIQSYCT